MSDQQKPAERIECAKCGCHHFEVSHTLSRAGQVRRRRLCRNCGRPLQTREIPESLYQQLDQLKSLYKQLANPKTN